MISIIIASVNDQQLADVKENIKQTIGVPYEIIVFGNKNGKVGLCELYNRGANQARFDILCYMHEDVLIQTQNWGEIVINSFKENQKLGLLGIVGSKYKATSPSGWSCYGLSAKRGVIIQGFKHEDKASIEECSNPDNNSYEKVACIDGVWFCTKKDIALSLKFDEDTLKGFHCYDIDYSLTVGQKYDVAVTFDVILEHFSEGSFEKSWMQEVLKLHKKWSDVLPLNIDMFDKKQIQFVEKRTFRFFIEQAKKIDFPAHKIFAILWTSRFVKYAGLKNFLKINLFLLKKLL
jgi:signal peptidase I